MNLQKFCCCFKSLSISVLARTTLVSVAQKKKKCLGSTRKDDISRHRSLSEYSDALYFATEVDEDDEDEEDEEEEGFRDLVDDTRLHREEGPSAREIESQRRMGVWE